MSVYLSLNLKQTIMKKIIIGSLVGALIMFIWSFLSWIVLPIHANTFAYTDKQVAIMQALADNGLETGAYGLSTAPTREEHFKAMQEGTNKGKPGAAMMYTKEDVGMGPKQQIVGFFFNFIMIFAACMLLVNNMSGSFFSRWWMVMMFAVVIIFGVRLMEWNWMGHTWNYTRDFVLDCALGWALNGVWLAWWLGKK
jgi:hypothetical protein